MANNTSTKTAEVTFYIKGPDEWGSLIRTLGLTEAQQKVVSALTEQTKQAIAKAPPPGQ